jgi:predicted O-methyltransferase YrrM
VANVLRPAYLRWIARASLDFDFEKRACDLTPISLESVCQERDELRVPPSAHVWGQTPMVDLLALCALVRAQRPTRLFEFGTFTGNATCAMAANSPLESHLFTLDLPIGSRNSVEGLNWESGIDDGVIGSQFRGSPYENRITQLWGDSRTFNTAPFRNSVDFVWIDACHEYDFVRNDSANAFDMTISGGVVAWHDFSRACPGVLRYVTELCREREVYWVQGTQVVFARV